MCWSCWLAVKNCDARVWPSVRGNTVSNRFCVCACVVHLNQNQIVFHFLGCHALCPSLAVISGAGEAALACCLSAPTGESAGYSCKEEQTCFVGATQFLMF